MALFGGCDKQGEEFTLDQLAGQQEAEDPQGQDGSLPAGSGAEMRENVVYVHVCGAVKEPGVFALTAGSRVFDAVAAAGGFTSQAEQDYVNLAAYVSDAEQIYIPTVEEAVELRKNRTAKSASGSSGLVNINIADAATLCTLPGIGESRAADIIAYREERGGFTMIAQIMEVPGIKESTFRKLESRITVE